MTVIIGLEHDSAFTIGADRYCGTSNYRDVMDRPKYVQRGPVVIASAGEFRPGQIAEMLPLGGARKRTGEDDMDYLVRTIVEPIRKRHSKERLEQTLDSNRWTLLLGYHARIYTVFSDYGVERSSRGFASIGAGEDFANAAMLAHKALAPRERLIAVLNDVETLCPVVCRPFDLITVKTPKRKAAA